MGSYAHALAVQRHEQAGLFCSLIQWVCFLSCHAHESAWGGECIQGTLFLGGGMVHGHMHAACPFVHLFTQTVLYNSRCRMSGETAMQRAVLLACIWVACAEKREPMYGTRAAVRVVPEAACSAWSLSALGSKHLYGHSLH